MKKKIKIGVLGGSRGSVVISYAKRCDDVEVVALCDRSVEVLRAQRAKFSQLGITFYDSFEEFICHDMDAVFLANYATEHAPYALRALERGMHVFSEVLPVQTMAEAVALVEAVEKTGLTYAFAENYCYMPATREMKKLYTQGIIGELEYAEGEYIHNCESIWPIITHGDEHHWRNNMYSTFYCTHSLGPILHATGLRPVSVVGFEGNKNERKLRVGAKGASFGIEMVTLENGAMVKSIHGDLYKDSIWYCMYGSKGRMESAREDAHSDHIRRLYVNHDSYCGDYDNARLEVLDLTDGEEKAQKFGHSGADYYAIHNFIQRLLGDPEADTVDIYEALDMFLPGMFAYRSILAGGIPMAIPDLRDKTQRDRWRNDRACTDPAVAGDQLLPTASGGTPQIDGGVYDYMKILSQP